MIDGYNLVCDCSYWTQALGWQELKPYVKGFIFRATYGIAPDTMFKTHLAGALDNGYDHIAAYAWFRPNQNVKQQLDVLREQLRDTPIKVVYADIEQSSMWYLDYLPRYDPTKLNDLIWQYMSGLPLLGIEPAVYSRATWIGSYCPAFADWMWRYPTWLASYPFDRTAVYLTWDQLLQIYAPKVFSPYYLKTWTFPKERTDVWQWSGDKFILPGVYGNVEKTKLMPIDLNYISDAAFGRMFIGEYTPPEPEPAYVWYQCFAAWGMKIRTAPLANAPDTGMRISYLTKFKVYETVNADGYEWGKLGDQKWTALNWSKKI